MLVLDHFFSVLFFPPEYKVFSIILGHFRGLLSAAKLYELI